MNSSSSTTNTNQDFLPSVERLRAIEQGYSEQNSEQDASSQHSYHILWWSIGLLLIAGLAFLMYTFLSSAPQFAISLSVPTVTISAGQPLSYAVSVSGKTGATIITLIQRGDNVLARSTTTITPAASLRILVPNNTSSGLAVLRVTAVSGSARAMAERQISISSGATSSGTSQNSQEKCTDNIQNNNEEGIDCGGLCTPCTGTVVSSCSSCDDQDSCTKDTCENGRCVNSAIAPCCGNFKCEQDETPIACSADCSLAVVTINPVAIVADAVTRAKTDIDKSLLLCSTLTKGYADACFAKISEVTRLSEPCSHVSDHETRDGCYLNHAQETNDFTVCDALENVLFKSSCNSLKNLNALARE